MATSLPAANATVNHRQIEAAGHFPEGRSVSMVFVAPASRRQFSSSRKLNGAGGTPALREPAAQLWSFTEIESLRESWLRVTLLTAADDIPPKN
jgi:hypothetical protein